MIYEVSSIIYKFIDIWMQYANRLCKKKKCYFVITIAKYNTHKIKILFIMTDLKKKKKINCKYKCRILE